MAVYKIFPTKDTTVYTEYPDMNTGMDEIVELIPKTTRSNFSQILMAFDFGEINDIGLDFSNIDIKTNLKLFIAQSSSLPANLFISANPITTKWENGTGRFKDERTRNSGATYRMRDRENFWGENPLTSTPKYDDSILALSEISIYTSKDINLDVTPLFEYWKSQTNNGLIITAEDGSVESINNASLKYFSRDTHTIYPPCLEIKWDDSKILPHQTLTVTDSDLYIGLSNNKGEFNENSINKFRVNVRPKHPKRKYQRA